LLEQVAARKLPTASSILLEEFEQAPQNTLLQQGADKVSSCRPSRTPTAHLPRMLTHPWVRQVTGLFKYDEVHRWAHWPYNDMSPRLTHGRGKRAPLQLPPRLAPPTASAVGPNHLTIKWKAEPAPPDSPFGSPHGACAPLHQPSP